MDKTQYKDVYVFVEQRDGVIQKVAVELLGKARELADALDMTQSAVSHQLRVLRQNGLVRYRKEGKTVYYSLDDDHVRTVLEQGTTHIRHKYGYEED